MRNGTSTRTLQIPPRLVTPDVFRMEAPRKQVLRLSASPAALPSLDSRSKFFNIDRAAALLLVADRHLGRPFDVTDLDKFAGLQTRCSKSCACDNPIIRGREFRERLLGFQTIKHVQVLGALSFARFAVRAMLFAIYRLSPATFAPPASF